MAERRVDPGGAGTPTPGGGGGLYGGGGGAPPPPAPSSKGTPSERAIFSKFINSHAALRPYATTIWNATRVYGGITATQLAAVIWLESRGKADAQSDKGALGIAQIFDNVANATNDAGVPFFRADHNISNADKLNPAFAIQYMAWRLSGYQSTHGGSIDDIWKGGYNPGYGPKEKGYVRDPVSQFLPKGYVGTGGLTIDQTGNKSNATGAYEAGLKNPYIVGVSKNGKLRVVSSSVPPANAIMYDGTPMTVADWDQLRRGLDQYFVSYTGGRPDNKTLLQYVNKGWSPYSLTVALAKSKSFTKSPIWKSQAPAYQAAAKDIVAAGTKAPVNLIRSAILNNWSTTAFQAVLRQSPHYTQSNEFASNTATLMNVHTSIMGNPDATGMETVKQAALAGWTPDQYGAYLRSTDQYVQSPEYQTKALNFLGSLGLITGKNPVLKKGQESPNENPNQPVGGPLPGDPRLKTAKALPNPEDTVATYG